MHVSKTLTINMNEELTSINEAALSIECLPTSLVAKVAKARWSKLQLKRKRRDNDSGKDSLFSFSLITETSAVSPERQDLANRPIARPVSNVTRSASDIYARRYESQPSFCSTAWSIAVSRRSRRQCRYPIRMRGRGFQSTSRHPRELCKAGRVSNVRRVGFRSKCPDQTHCGQLPQLGLFNQAHVALSGSKIWEQVPISDVDGAFCFQITSQLSRRGITTGNDHTHLCCTRINSVSQQIYLPRGVRSSLA